jgi:hypothetical protein
MQSNARQFILGQVEPDGRFRFSPAGPAANLYATCFAVLGLDLLGALPALDADQRARVVAFLQRHQDPATGTFREAGLAPPPGATHDLTYVEHQQTDFALMALDALGAESLHELSFVQEWLRNAPGPWLDSLAWRDPWRESNRVMFVLNFLLREADRATPLARTRVDQILSWLDAHQDPRNGLWNLGHPVSLVNQMAGAYHFLLFYTYVGRRPHHMERIIDACLDIQDHDGLFTYAGGGGSCEDLDAIDLLCRCWLETGHRTRAVRRALGRAHRALVGCQNTDGGFCWARRDRLSPAKFLHLARPSLLAVSVGEFRDNARDKWRNQKAVLRDPASLTWAYSGLEPMRIPLSASDLWSTWFRMLTLAIIEDTMPDVAATTPFAWNMRRKPGLGFFRAVSTP